MPCAAWAPAQTSHRDHRGARFDHDRQAFLPRPPVPYEACDTRTTRVTSLSLVRYRRNASSVPTAYGHREVVVKGFVDDVVKQHTNWMTTRK